MLLAYWLHEGTHANDLPVMPTTRRRMPLSLGCTGLLLLAVTALVGQHGYLVGLVIWLALQGIMAVFFTLAMPFLVRHIAALRCSPLSR